MAPDSLLAAVESMQQLQPLLFAVDVDSQEGAIHIHGIGIPACSFGQANSAKMTKITILYYLYSIPNQSYKKQVNFFFNILIY
jgi:hypothetical protein